MDEKAGALAFANVVLRNPSDSSMVKIGITNGEGGFEFEGNFPPKLYVEASMVGFRRYKSEAFSIQPGQTLKLEPITLLPTDKTLNEVTVQATKPMVTVEPDRLILNVDNNPLMINTNALEVLRKAPGVVVNQDDQVFLQGKSGLLILIDGRPSPLAEKDLANWLRSIPSNMIESIEVITNPPARYDAAGNAGIINIRLKKNTRRGLNGSWSSGLNRSIGTENDRTKTNHSFTLNRGWKSFNMFLNYGMDLARNWNFMDIYRIQSEMLYDQKTSNLEKNQSHNAKTGFDWRINRLHSLSLTADGVWSENRTSTTSFNKIRPVTSTQLHSLLDARNDSRRELLTSNVNLFHSYKDTLGRELSTDFNYGTYGMGNRTFQPNFYRNYFPDSSVVDRSFGLNTPVDIRMLTLKSDFDYKKGPWQWSTGYKVSDVLTDNAFSLYDRADGKNEKDPGQSSVFSYLERVVAGYGSMRWFYRKWTLQAGLRVEHTESKGHLRPEMGRDSIVNRSYTDPFPSGGLAYRPSETHAFSLNYSRRIDRPVYRFLNPFQYKLDELSYEQGNPFLKPQYTHNIQLNYTYRSSANASIGFSQTDQFFARVIDSLGPRSYLTRRNLAQVNTLSFNLSTPLPFTRWWNGFFNFTYNYQEYEADFGQGKRLFIPINYYNLYMQHSFTLPKDLSVQLSGYYNSPNVWGGTFRNRAFWGTELGLNKKVLQKKGTLSLSVSDLFLSQRWQGKSDFGGVNITVTGGWDSRQIKLAFSYQFGQNENRQNRKRPGNSEERQRLRGE